MEIKIRNGVYVRVNQEEGKVCSGCAFKHYRNSCLRFKNIKCYHGLNMKYIFVLKKNLKKNSPCRKAATSQRIAT
jgi:hypothetical protein